MKRELPHRRSTAAGGIIAMISSMLFLELFNVHCPQRGALLHVVAPLRIDSYGLFAG